MNRWDISYFIVGAVCFYAAHTFHRIARDTAYAEGYSAAVSKYTEGYPAGYKAGYDHAQHDVALHWYRFCIADPREQGLNPALYCGADGGEMYAALGFRDRWPEEMP